jgi:ATP-binding cassette, subfamily B, bacterial PglK
MKILRNIRSIIAILSAQERRALLSSLLIMLFSSLLDMAGVVSLVPFLTAVSNLDNFQNVGYLSWFYEFFGFTDIRLFLISLAACSFTMLILNNVVRVVTIWYNYKVSMDIWHKLHVQVFQYYLEQPYTFHLNKNSSELIDKLMTRVNAVASGIVTPSLLMVTHGLTGGLVMILLLWQDFVLTLGLIGFLAVFYRLGYHFVEHKIAEYGKTHATLGPQLLKLASESFGGIKELKALGRESTFYRRFNKNSRAYADVGLKWQVAMIVPSGLVEIMSIGSILLIGSYLIFTIENFAEILPVLGIYVIASRRLQPALTNIFLQAGHIRYYQTSFDLILPDIKEALSKKTHGEKVSASSDTLDFGRAIEIRDIEYQYSKSDKKVLDKLTMTIPPLSMVGIVGGSGVGKTTLVDLILRLLEPSAGDILIGGHSLGQNGESKWRKHIGYVPQHVYLADDTVAHNVAFAVDDEDIDMDALLRAVELAQVRQFIESELPLQYETLIGERGIRLSGGQRQRLGIARALYHDPEILVLDEATSALDGITEQDFMRAVGRLARKKTIIIIAHRLTTLKDCDEIFVLERGSVTARGSYDDLIANNALFAKMANEGERSNDVELG